MKQFLSVCNCLYAYNISIAPNKSENSSAILHHLQATVHCVQQQKILVSQQNNKELTSNENVRKPGLCIITLVKRCLLQEKKELDDTEQREPLNEKPKENWDEELNEEGQVRIRVFF